MYNNNDAYQQQQMNPYNNNPNTAAGYSPNPYNNNVTLILLRLPLLLLLKADRQLSTMLTSTTEPISALSAAETLELLL